MYLWGSKVSLDVGPLLDVGIEQAMGGGKNGFPYWERLLQIVGLLKQGDVIGQQVVVNGDERAKEIRGRYRELLDSPSQDTGDDS